MSGEAQVRLTGGCQCGAVRYRLASPPTGENVCHCRMCQKAGGGPFMAFAGVQLDEVRYFEAVDKAQQVWRTGRTGQFLLASLKVERFRRGWMGR